MEERKVFCRLRAFKLHGRSHTSFTVSKGQKRPKLPEGPALPDCPCVGLPTGSGAETGGRRWWQPGAGGAERGVSVQMGVVSGFQGKKVLEMCFIAM